MVDDIVATARRAWPEGSPEHYHDLRAAIWVEIRKRGLDHVAKAGGKGASPEQRSIFSATTTCASASGGFAFMARHLAEEVEE